MRASRLLPIPLWLFTALPLGSPGAEAAGETDPRELEARERCDSGDVRAGVAQLAQLYVATLNPIYVYRQAQCFQRNGRDENAIERYREYLRRTREVTPKGRQWIESRIRELEASSRAAALVPPPVSVPPPHPSEPVSPGGPSRIQPASARLQGLKDDPTSGGAAPWVQPPSGPGPRAAGGPGDGRAVAGVADWQAPGQSWQRLSSLVLATAAGAALGTAVTFHVAREDSARQYNRHCFPFKVGACTDMEARVTSTQTGAVLAYAGAAVLAVGSTFFYLSAPESRTAGSRPSMVALACRPSGLQGVSCGGRF
jgi:hypothetical protein